MAYFLIDILLCVTEFNKEYGGSRDPQTDSYCCGVFEEHPAIYGASRLLMLDDATVATIPSAVVWFVGSLPIY